MSLSTTPEVPLTCRLLVGAEVDLHHSPTTGRRDGSVSAHEPVAKHHVYIYINDYDAPDGDLPVALPAAVLARALVEPGVHGGGGLAATWGRGESTAVGTNSATEESIPTPPHRTRTSTRPVYPHPPSPLHTVAIPHVDRLGDPGALGRPAGLDSLRSTLGNETCSEGRPERGF